MTYNETIFNTQRYSEQRVVDSLEVVPFEAVFGVVADTTTADDQSETALADIPIKNRGLKHFYPSELWEKLPKVRLQVRSDGTCDLLKIG